jgi:hypothetical protein
MSAYAMGNWPVAIVPPAVQHMNGDAQHFRDIGQRTSTCRWPVIS